MDCMWRAVQDSWMQTRLLLQLAVQLISARHILCFCCHVALKQLALSTPVPYLQLQHGHILRYSEQVCWHGTVLNVLHGMVATTESMLYVPMFRLVHTSTHQPSSTTQYAYQVQCMPAVSRQCAESLVGT
jgi:hypothetical protein